MARRSLDQRAETLLAGRIAPRIQTVLIERLFEGVDLRLGNLHFGLAELREVSWRDKAREQSNDYDDHQQLYEREPLSSGHGRVLECV